MIFFFDFEEDHDDETQVRTILSFFHHWASFVSSLYFMLAEDCAKRRGGRATLMAARWLQNRRLANNERCSS